MRGINRSIFRRLVVTHLVVILIGLTTTGLIAAWLVKGFIHDNRREQLLRQARQANTVLRDIDPADEAALAAQLAFLDRAYGAHLWLFDPYGRILATSAEAQVYVGKSVATPVLRRVLRGEDVVEPLTFPGLEPVLSVVVPWGQGVEVRGGLIMHAPVEGLNQTVGRIRETILWATLAAVLVATLAGSYLSWTISQPLKQMELVAAEIGNGKYDRRVTVDSPDEIGDLAAAINRMAGELAAVEAERRNLTRAREDLFANISHELRTPLTAILGFLEALQDGFAENRQQEQLYLAVAYREALHLKRMIEDLLDLARLTAGRTELHTSTVDAVRTGREVLEELSPMALQRKNQLHLQPEGEGPICLQADPVRLRQILTNLIENAIKFTENGHITLTVAGADDGVTIKVRDTGIGIAESDLPLIWERFYKADRLRTRNRGGTGLGLAIVRELVARHGGKVDVESQVGQGTLFTLWLPAGG